jgi:hypothetical protein
MLVTLHFRERLNCKLRDKGTPRPMRKYPHKNPLQKSPPTRFQPSRLTILIATDPSSTNPLLQQRPKCLLLTALPITAPLQRAKDIPQSPNLRRTIGRRSQILKREDAFRTELHSESSVCLIVPPSKPRSPTDC